MWLLVSWWTVSAREQEMKHLQRAYLKSLRKFMRNEVKGWAAWDSPEDVKAVLRKRALEQLLWMKRAIDEGDLYNV